MEQGRHLFYVKLTLIKHGNCAPYKFFFFFFLIISLGYAWVSAVHITDHFHKWRPLLHSFVFMLIRPTALILKQKFFSNLFVVARLERLISIKTKEYFIWPPLWKRSMSGETNWCFYLKKAVTFTTNITSAPNLNYGIYKIFQYNVLKAVNLLFIVQLFPLPFSHIQWNLGTWKLVYVTGRWNADPGLSIL